MKKTEKYECEFCHEVYDTEEECQKCESSHHMPKKMVSVCFSAKNPMNEFYEAPYPMSIVVRMDDDKEIKYFIDPVERKTKTGDSFSQFGDVFDNLFKTKR